MHSFVALAGRLAAIFRNRREARILAGLDARMLADIGLNRADLRDAFAEPLWRDPTCILEMRAAEKRTHQPRYDKQATLVPARARRDCPPSRRPTRVDL
jgi:uncharacterized protein YjiS (DUF1127 family)